MDSLYFAFKVIINEKKPNLSFDLKNLKLLLFFVNEYIQ